jgi:hypothetical protein
LILHSIGPTTRSLTFLPTPNLSSPRPRIPPVFLDSSAAADRSILGLVVVVPQSAVPTAATHPPLSLRTSGQVHPLMRRVSLAARHPQNVLAVSHTLSQTVSVDVLLSLRRPTWAASLPTTIRARRIPRIWTTCALSTLPLASQNSSRDTISNRKWVHTILIISWGTSVLAGCPSLSPPLGLDADKGRPKSPTRRDVFRAMASILTGSPNERCLFGNGCLVESYIAVCLRAH